LIPGIGAKPFGYEWTHPFGVRLALDLQ